MRVTDFAFIRRVLFTLGLLLLPLWIGDPGASAAAQTALDGAMPRPTVGLGPFDPDALFAGNIDEEPSLPIAGRLSSPLEIALLLTLLSLLPAALISVTCFTRIVIVLSFVRRSLSTNELPPNPVILGLALFLTAFVMAPVGTRMHAEAWVPYQEGTMGAEEAASTAWSELRGFLLANTRPGELEFFRELSGEEHASLAADELPFQVVVPAFVVSELKTAFQMGFLLFLPFLVIDLVVASVLLSMGMFMLPPVMISTPFKILLFVLVDGWELVCRSLVTSFTV